MKCPCWAAVGQPLGGGRWATEILIRRIAPRSETLDRPVHRDQVPRFDPAINLPRDKHVVLVPDSLVDLKGECRKGDIDAATGARELNRPGRIAKLPATDLEGIQVRVAPAESDLQCGVKFGQECLFRDQEWRITGGDTPRSLAFSRTAPTFCSASIGRT